MYIHLFIICHNINLSKCTLYNNKMQHINVKTSLQSTGTLKDEVGGGGQKCMAGRNNGVLLKRGMENGTERETENTMTFIALILY